MQDNQIYDQGMMEKYQNRVNCNSLKIRMDQKLKNLEFLQKFDLSKLCIDSCTSIIPKLNSKTIKELALCYCTIQCIDEFELENLEVLILKKDKYEDGQVQNIIKYRKLKQLELLQYHDTDINIISQIVSLISLKLDFCGLIDIDTLKSLTLLKELSLSGNFELDISPLPAFVQLVALDLSSCSLRDISKLQSLTNLKQLSLNGNYGVDIAPLQYIKQLTYLDLGFCCLKSVDILRALLNLEEIQLNNNSIVYIQPLYDLKFLSKANATNNTIVDAYILESHTNFNEFSLGEQQEPTKYDMASANQLKNINSPIFMLRKLFSMRNQFKSQYDSATQNANKYVQELVNKHIQSVGQFATMFQRLNQIEVIQ
ncbi:leucine-rich_repeat domain-containing protein [Hexamita inflata]|uniref:Leucine-rich repeat domain-containing protein n=1 Tax=Hexamita inflata TaxID=28002 RepID=A0AA86U785_9EUKA|nr:leucine-rich repeat domain-containing protein [Hexamita inflata]CAI9932488.1 leucine-rich repeat domain-containing protein [Hexamita inflata]CAI9932495.1 leucine-rich repeat domain-containing protein [Hexamita inflata]